MSEKMEDREIMGTPEAAKADLIAKAVAWRKTRQPGMDTAAGHRARDIAEHEIRFQLANAALLWLWHEENPASALSSPAEGEAGELTANFTQSLPGGKLDDSTYEKIETALDKIDAPCHVDGKWLSLHERVAAIAPPRAAVSPPQREEMIEAARWAICKQAGGAGRDKCTNNCGACIGEAEAAADAILALYLAGDGREADSLSGEKSK